MAKPERPREPDPPSWLAVFQWIAKASWQELLKITLFIIVAALAFTTVILLTPRLQGLL